MFKYTTSTTRTVGIPVIAPIRITHPNWAPIISLTAAGPGVGGIKTRVVANPDSRGMAYNKRDFFVFLCKV